MPIVRHAVLLPPARDALHALHHLPRLLAEHRRVARAARHYADPAAAADASNIAATVDAMTTAVRAALPVPVRFVRFATAASQTRNAGATHLQVLCEVTIGRQQVDAGALLCSRARARERRGGEAPQLREARNGVEMAPSCTVCLARVKHLLAAPAVRPARAPGHASDSASHRV